MTFHEAMTKTQEDEKIEKTRKNARRHLMRKIYRDVCRKIGCRYCVAYGSCHFCEFKTRVGYNYALFNMKDEDIIKVIEWLNAEGKEQHDSNKSRCKRENIHSGKEECH